MHDQRLLGDIILEPLVKLLASYLSVNEAQIAEWSTN